MKTEPRSDPTPVTKRRSRAAVGLIVALLLATHWVVAVLSVRHKSSTSDEIVHLTAGVYKWKKGDYRLVPDHPPLAQMWAALPVVTSDFSVPDAVGPDWWESNAWKMGKRFFYESGNDVHAILVRGRVMIALLSAALGLLVWWWSRRLFGHAGGLLSLVLYTFSPTMLAHGRLITTDTAASLFFLASVSALWGVLHRVSVASVLLSALALSGLLLSKVSALLILPMAGVLILIRLASGRSTTVALPRAVQVQSRSKQVGVWILAAVAHTVIAVSLIWAAHGFTYSAMSNAEPGRDRFFTPYPLASHIEPWDYMLGTLGKKGSVIAWVRDHKLLPESYLLGVAFVMRHGKVRSAFLNGENHYHGWWYFFPYCFMVKTPLPLLGILFMAVAACAAALRRRGNSPPTNSRWKTVADGLYRTTPLWVLLTVYGAFAIASNLNIGLRHILPIYPVLFIFAGSAARWSCSLGTLKGWVVPGLTVLFMSASLRMFPNYLAYFNALAGGPASGYKHLVDSSLDWGQDLPGLKRWLDAYRWQRKSEGQTAMPPVYLSYFTTGHPPYYGIEAQWLPSFMPWEPPRWAPLLTGGVYCISATMLQQMGLLPECRWTEALEAAYQDHRKRWANRITRQQAEGTPGREPADLTPPEVEFLLRLRFARLCAFLRQREPDDHVGYSILIYVLGDDDVRRAIDGQPAELLADTPTNLRRLASRSLRGKQLASAATFYLFLLRSETGSVESEVVNAVVELGSSLAAHGRTREAIEVFRNGLRHAPKHLGLNNDLAWLLATTKADDLRDGAEALRLAEIANQASGGRNPSVLDTLAAAHAQLGQFDEAVRYAGKALSLARAAGRKKPAGQISERLELYKAGQPYREP